MWDCHAVLAELPDQRLEHILRCLLLCVLKMEIEVTDDSAGISITQMSEVLYYSRAENSLAAARYTMKP